MTRILAYIAFVVFIAQNIGCADGIDIPNILDNLIPIDLTSCEKARDSVAGLTCPEGTSFSDGGLQVNLAGIVDFSLGCCLGVDVEAQVCASAIGLPGAACLDGRVYDASTAEVTLDLLSNFDNQCCKEKVEPDCIPEVTACQHGLGIAGFVCLEGRVFDPNLYANTISGRLDFDKRCCKDISIDIEVCAQALGVGGSKVCASGNIYDPSKALIAANGKAFDNTCCKTNLNDPNLELSVCSQALGVAGYACPANYIYNPRLSCISINADPNLSSEKEFENNCCKPVDLNVQVCAQALGVLGYTCGNGRKYDLLKAAVFVNRPGDFDSQCCMVDESCEETCNTKTVDTCQAAVGLLGYNCVSGRAYVGDNAAVAISAASEFDSKCCDTDLNIQVDTCGDLLGKATCLEGRLYSAGKINIEAKISTFDDNCCIGGVQGSVDVCVKALGLVGYTCDGDRGYDVAQAQVDINGDFDANCCKDPLIAAKLCANFLGVLGYTCGTHRILDTNVITFGDNNDSFDDTCCKDESYEGFDPTRPDCTSVCNVVDVPPTCFQAAGLKGYTCAAGRVYKSLLANVLCPGSADFDANCCEAPTCDQARNLDGFICAQARIYAPSKSDVTVSAAVDFDATCCETNVNALNVCGNLVGTKNYHCENGRAYSPSFINAVVAEVASFDSICCADTPANVDIDTCIQALGVSGNVCADGRAYNPLAAYTDITFKGDFDKTCCTKQEGLGIQVCAAVLGIVDFTCEDNRHYDLLSAGIAVSSSSDFDSHCCQDNTPLLSGANIFDPLLPDCITETEIARPCSEAKSLSGYECSTNYSYDTLADDTEVANAGVYNSVCCKQNCLKKQVGKWTVEVYRTCQVSNSGVEP